MTSRHSVEEAKPPAAMELEDLKAGEQPRDYSGAHEKTDPKEIALVRKLDWYIMPILWFMYWLNYLVKFAPKPPSEHLSMLLKWC